MQNQPGMFSMTCGTTMDDGSGPFVVGTQTHEDVETEIQTHEAEETEEPNAEEVNEQETVQEPRRSTRQSNRPGYLDDYVLLADIE